MSMDSISQNKRRFRLFISPILHTRMKGQAGVCSEQRSRVVSEHMRNAFRQRQRKNDSKHEFDSAESLSPDRSTYISLCASEANGVIIGRQNLAFFTITAV